MQLLSWFLKSLPLEVKFGIVLVIWYKRKIARKILLKNLLHSTFILASECLHHLTKHAVEKACIEGDLRLQKESLPTKKLEKVINKVFKKIIEKKKNKHRSLS